MFVLPGLFRIFDSDASSLSVSLSLRYLPLSHITLSLAC